MNGGVSVEEYIPYVDRIARHFHWLPIDHEDLVQAGCEALVKCARKYDAAQFPDESFWACACVRVKGSMVDEARRWTKADRNTGAVPSRPRSLDEAVFEDGDITLGDTIKAPADCYFLLDSIMGLPERDREVCLLVALGEKMHEVGDRLGVTESRISQIFARVRMRLEPSYV